jgi:hypothetical protein
MICSCPGVEGRDLSVRRDGRALHSSRYATARSRRWKTEVPGHEQVGAAASRAVASETDPAVDLDPDGFVRPEPVQA